MPYFNNVKTAKKKYVLINFLQIYFSLYYRFYKNNLMKDKV